MTKKEQKQIEIAKANELYAKRTARKQFINEMIEFQKDVDAISRVKRMDGSNMTTKDFEDVMNRYPMLKENGYYFGRNDDDNDIERFTMDVFYSMRKSNSMSQCSYNVPSYDRLQHSLDENDLLVENLHGDKMETLNYLYFMEKYGYDRMVFVDNSSSSLESLTIIIEMGGKVVGTNPRASRGGLIINIDGIDIKKAAEKVELEQRTEYLKRGASWGNAPDQTELDAIHNRFAKIYK